MDHLFTDHLAEDDEAEIASPGVGSATIRAFVLSAGIHGLGLWLLISLTPNDLLPETALTSVSLRLRIIAPIPTSVESVPQSPEADLAEPTAETIIEGSVPVVNPPSTVRIEMPSVQPVSPSPEAGVVERRPVELRVPSVSGLRQIVEALPEADTLQRPAFECTALQLENEILACDNRPPRDFDASSRTRTITYFARPPGPGRTERSIQVLSARSDEIAQTLRQGGLSNDFIDNFLGDLKSFAADYSSTGDSKLQQLRNQMYSNDSTYQQRKRALLQQ